MGARFRSLAGSTNDDPVVMEPVSQPADADPQQPPERKHAGAFVAIPPEAANEKWTAWLIFQDLMCVRRQMRSEDVDEKETARRLPLFQMAHLGRALVY